jgi:hypothetical protein
VDELVIARNPDSDSRLPYLIRLPLGPDGLVLKAGGTWPREKAVYCHREAVWPADAQIVERVPVRSCVRRGAAIDLILDRNRENRSQIVFTSARGREAVFWQTARVRKQARPGVRTPTARASGMERLPIIVDDRERYAYRFARHQVELGKRRLTVGDYAVELDGRTVAAVERKSLPDLVASLTGGTLKYAVAELAALPRAALVVEDRYSQVFKLERVRPAVVADALAELQVTWPNVATVFCETRPLAEDWTYRYLAAAYAAALAEPAALTRLAAVPSAGPVEPSTAQVRAWARAHDLDVPDRGRLRPEIWDAYRAAHRLP